MARSNRRSKTVAAVTAIVVVWALLSCAPQATPTKAPEAKPAEEAMEVAIEDLKGAEWQNYVGQTVKVKGVFVRDPTPVLVTDLEVVLVDMMMPEPTYLVLTGEVAEGINPEKYGGATLSVTGQVVSLRREVGEQEEYPAVAIISYAMLPPGPKVPYNPRIRTILGVPYEHLRKDRYAVLFSGGGDVANNHARYWNHLKFMYSTLVNTYGYDPENITVLYADGTAVDTDVPVDGSGTEPELRAAFDDLREVLTPRDFLFVYTTNHGGGFYANDPDHHYNWYTGRWDTDGDEAAVTLNESTYHRDFNYDGDQVDDIVWDEELTGWGDGIYDDEFLDMTADLRYGTMVIVTVQCFGGGMIDDLARGGSDRIIITATDEYSPSKAMPPNYDYSEFTYHFICAVNGADPDGNAVDADADGDGRVSMVEAFNYASSNDTRPETPQYEDDGDGLPHSGNMPAGGDGTLGESTFLD
jgi:hypothetical protein